MTGKYRSFNEFSGGDDTARFAAAMEFLRRNPGTELFVPPGTYTLTSEPAQKARDGVMSGAFGKNPQKVMFNPKYRYTRGIDFSGQKGTKLSACGVTLMVDGFMEPVSLVGCEDVEISGLAIDHVRKPFSRGRVSAVRGEGRTRVLTVELDEGCPVERGTPLGLRHLLIDEETDRAVKVSVKNTEFLSPLKLEATVETECAIPPKALFYVWHTYHSRPAILIENSRNVRLTDVTIHSQPGMGVVGNRCENVTLSRLRVVPSGGDHVSTNTDATHFTSAKGFLRYEDCVFLRQGDDFANVHAYYQAVVGRDGEKAYYIQEKTPDGTHAQSLDYPDVGDTLELVNRETLEALGTYEVTACRPEEERWITRVELDRPLPENTEGLMLSDVTRLPELEIRRCRAESHFARGALIKTRSAVVEGCVFRDIMGPAVVAAAESWWWEGVCPANVTVRGNLIENCGEFFGEAAGVVVKADADRALGQSIFNISVKDNVINAPNCRRGIFVRNASGVRIENNRITCSGEPVAVENCTQADVNGTEI
ncbi:MAG: right-handed parallel beta-helix repeat-containing protein [Clostridiales bacterium]|nr:right-handed parallel beta-helix repeat-containing protein [Clostridiales bacterium]